MADEGVDEATPYPEAAPPPSERVQELEEELETSEQRIEELEAELEEARQQLEERTDALARVQADFENYRKRVDQEKQEARQEARAELVEVLAGVLDDVSRALQADPDENVRKGLELLTRGVEDELDSLGAARVEPEPGEAFDPDRHEALLTEATDEQPPDTVLELLQPGFALDDRLVRAARVKVAKAPAD